ncbi:MAG: hypothetical protein HYV07_03625 [Deltaproteobacteria bacterium]|nr:hypothetical protein [Deltaproteobacteria bacterium]
MERVDVLVLGATIEGLSAARAAAANGVRVALLDPEPLLEEDPTLHAVLSPELDALALDAKDPERSIERLQVAAQLKTAIGGELVRHVVRADRITEKLTLAAKRQGAELRFGLGALEVRAEASGWVVTSTLAEPHWAEAIIVADGPRSPTLSELGVFESYRVHQTFPGVLSYLSATWKLGDNAESYDAIQISETRGPLGGMWMVPGATTASAAIGPVWRGVARPQYDWASATDRVVPTLLDQASSELRLAKRPIFIDLIETRIDAIPSPAAFERAVAVGAATGHGPRSPLLSAGSLARAGNIVGRGVADSVKSKTLDARSLSRALEEPLSELTAWCTAQLALEARGMRHPRARSL